MKPNGIAIGLHADGQLSFRATHPTRTEDAIWEAVECAINEGWDARRFRNEVASAWSDILKQSVEDAVKILEGK